MRILSGDRNGDGEWLGCAGCGACEKDMPGGDDEFAGEREGLDVVNVKVIARASRWWAVTMPSFQVWFITSVVVWAHLASALAYKELSSTLTWRRQYRAWTVS